MRANQVGAALGAARARAVAGDALDRVDLAAPIGRRRIDPVTIGRADVRAVVRPGPALAAPRRLARRAAVRPAAAVTDEPMTAVAVKTTAPDHAVFHT